MLNKTFDHSWHYPLLKHEEIDGIYHRFGSLHFANEIAAFTRHTDQETQIGIERYNMKTKLSVTTSNRQAVVVKMANGTGK